MKDATIYVSFEIIFSNLPVEFQGPDLSATLLAVMTPTLTPNCVLDDCKFTLIYTSDALIRCQVLEARFLLVFFEFPHYPASH